MAKKKVEESDGFDVISSTVKQYGNVIQSADSILEEKLEIFSTGSPLLDFSMKGWMEGTTNIISGPKKLGKTSLVLQSFVDYQKRGRKTFIIDVENRVKPLNITGIKGLDPSKLQVVRSVKDSMLNGNELLDITANIMKAEPGAAVFIDSGSAILPAERVGENVDGQYRSTTPKLLGDFFRKTSSTIRVNRISLFMTLHLITNTGPQGRKFIEDSGVYVMYQSDCMLRGEWSEKWVEAERTVGQIIHWNLVTGSTCGPVEKIDSYLRYGIGFDVTKELFTIACDMGLVVRKGSWYELSFLSEPIQKQGDTKCLEYLEEHPEAIKLLKQKITELVV